MLTAKREKFCQNLINGMTQTDAYRAAYNTKGMSDRVVWQEASLLAKNPKVALRLKELREELAEANRMTVEERFAWLSKLVRENGACTSDKLKAIDQMNKMEGVYSTKLEGSIGVVNKLEDLL